MRDALDEGSTTPLIEAIVNQDEEEISFCLDRSSLQIDEPDWAGRTPLMYAGRNGHATTVQVLLQANADADKTEGKQQTVLMLACSDGHEAVVRALLQAGASTLATNVQGETAVSLATKHGHTSCVSLLQAANGQRRVTP